MRHVYLAFNSLAHRSHERMKVVRPPGHREEAHDHLSGGHLDHARGRERKYSESSEYSAVPHEREHKHFQPPPGAGVGDMYDYDGGWTPAAASSAYPYHQSENGHSPHRYAGDDSVREGPHHSQRSRRGDWPSDLGDGGEGYVEEERLPKMPRLPVTTVVAPAVYVTPHSPIQPYVASVLPVRSAGSLGSPPQQAQIWRPPQPGTAPFETTQHPARGAVGVGADGSMPFVHQQIGAQWLTPGGAQGWPPHAMTSLPANAGLMGGPVFPAQGHFPMVPTMPMGSAQGLGPMPMGMGGGRLSNGMPLPAPAYAGGLVGGCGSRAGSVSVSQTGSQRPQAPAAAPMPATVAANYERWRGADFAQAPGSLPSSFSLSSAAPPSPLSVMLPASPLQSGGGRRSAAGSAALSSKGALSTSSSPPSSWWLQSGQLQSPPRHSVPGSGMDALSAAWMSEARKVSESSHLGRRAEGTRVVAGPSLGASFSSQVSEARVLAGPSLGASYSSQASYGEQARRAGEAEWERERARGKARPVSREELLASGCLVEAPSVDLLGSLPTLTTPESSVRHARAGSMQVPSDRAPPTRHASGQAVPAPTVHQPLILPLGEHDAPLDGDEEDYTDSEPEQMEGPSSGSAWSRGWESAVVAHGSHRRVPKHG